MKRKIALLVFVIMFMVSINSFAEKNQLFLDTKSTDWFIKDLSYLVSLNGISGYPDGSFKPNKEITKAEFIKVLISSIGHKNLKTTNSNWSSPYINKSLELGLITKDNLDNLNKPITRYEMAVIVSNTLEYLEENIPANIESFSSYIKDIHKINDENLYNSVLNTYVKGIISGYPDGSFAGNNFLSRAEASSVIVRVIDKDSRIKQNLDQAISFADDVLRIVNKERNKEGLSKLEFCKNLNSVANLKSKDMSTYNYFDHVSPNHGNLFDILKKKNIDYRAGGENIAVGHTSPKQVVEAWMNSPGHRRNILNANYNKTGIGIYVGDRIYWTQNFTD